MAGLKELFNHVVLPPDLPTQEDTNLPAIGDALAARLQSACNIMVKESSGSLAATYQHLHMSLRLARQLNFGRLDKEKLLDSLNKLQPNEVIILDVTKQNAGLLIRTSPNDKDETSVIFETFETSAPSAIILQAADSLQWDFPGRAVQIPLSTFNDTSFQEALATFLERASMESLHQFQAKVQKAGNTVIEVRDVSEPTIISQMLMSIIEAMGSAVDVPHLRKRVRDDVNFRNAKLPWRRHPYWLVLRVSLQRQLGITLGAETGRACYKLLMAQFHAELLLDCTGKLAPQAVHSLRSKLCRRMAKLANQSPGGSAEYKSMFDLVHSRISRRVEGAIQSATSAIEDAWSQFKRRNMRPVPTLQKHASLHDTTLALHNSGFYLDHVLHLHSQFVVPGHHITLPVEELSKTTESQQLASKHMQLAKADRAAQRQLAEYAATDTATEDHIQAVADKIIEHIATVGEAYKGDPLLISSMLLTVFELWVAMDKAAVEICPELKQYHPVLTAPLLDTLQLERHSDLDRLAAIQDYLFARCSASKSADASIFHQNGRWSFAFNYYQRSATLQRLFGRIQRDSAAARARKEEEWESMKDEYADLSRKIEQGTCICSINADGSRNVKGCNKCWHWRTRNRLQINVHEDFLPADAQAAAIVVFELGMPDFLRQYRDVTFKLICDIAHPSNLSDKRAAPVLMLQDYSQLRTYSKGSSRFTMASSTKSHLTSHYKVSQVNASANTVLTNLGATFEYYDTSSRQWLHGFPRIPTQLTLQHLCGVSIPRSLKVVLPHAPHPPINGNHNISSYQIQANRAKCPKHLPVHEFSSLQKLVSASSLRWSNILVELCASNLNFSSAETTQLICELSTQAGPQSPGKDVRDYHAMFLDSSFIERLCEQVEAKLQSISTNWGELHCMDLIITLSLRILSMTDGASQSSALALISSAREVTVTWIRHFREESETASTSAAAKKSAQNAAWAALLCRKTLSALLHVSSSGMGSQALTIWTEASICLHDGLPPDLASLPHVLRRLLQRDSHYAAALERKVRTAIKDHSRSLEIALLSCVDTSIQPTSDPTQDSHFTPWEETSGTRRNWISSSSGADTYCFNYMTGRLLVNGRALGKLPQDLADCDDVRELFGDRHLLAYPSTLPGMTHRLSKQIEGNVVHLGSRDGSVIIQAQSPMGLLEFVPRRIFEKGGTFDLPKELIAACIHWLNLRDGELECRRKPNIWHPTLRNWIIHTRQREATRSKSRLICPHSHLFANIYRLIEHFEKPTRITAYAAQSMRIHIALRDLELSFTVNGHGLLECNELHAELDPNQDAGTLYGLRSKLVLRDIRTDQRLVLVPLDPPSWGREGIHVGVTSTGISGYAKFEIDEILGRLNCPPEPRLLFTKALMHALTSFVVPDRLTGKTGTEEAFDILTSAAAQPWSPLNDPVVDALKSIQGLCPRREFYPTDRKTLQTITWDEHLSPFIQHDAFDAIVQRILDKSSNTSAFSMSDANLLADSSISWLRQRASVRRGYRERANASTASILAIPAEDLLYESRDKETNAKRSVVTYNSTKTVLDQGYRINIETDYHKLLCKWGLIGGVGDNVELLSSSLAGLLDTKIDEHWFGLLDLCTGATRYELVFILGALAFNRQGNQEILSILAAYGCINELKDLDLPEYTSFVNYQSAGIPDEDEMLDLISSTFTKHVPDLSMKKAQRDRRIREHEARCRRAATQSVRNLLEQWPVSEPVFDNDDAADADVFDHDSALALILPEWDRRIRNTALTDYVKSAQSILDHHRLLVVGNFPLRYTPKDPETCRPAGSISPVVPVSLHDIAVKVSRVSNEVGSGPNVDLLMAPGMTLSTQSSAVTDVTLSRTLETLLRVFASSKDHLRTTYAENLLLSLEAARRGGRVSHSVNVTTGLDLALSRALQAATIELSDARKVISQAMANEDSGFIWLARAGLWPSVSLTSLLPLLRAVDLALVSSPMKDGLVHLALCVHQLQRLKRIYAAWRKNDVPTVKSELANRGHENWVPSECSDWLLIEIDGNITIRPEQVEVARAVIAPPSGHNSVLQMNMGQGKTSVIVPLVMAILADTSQLVRLIVPRPLIFQTAQVLQSRLSLLAGREVSHLTYTRRTPTTSAMLGHYRQQHENALKSGGLIITSPENLLSFKLNGWQSLSDGKLEVARELLQTQALFEQKARDIIDESDFTLGVKTQLTYPSGAQTPVDGNPWRWETVQKLIGLIEAQLAQVRAKFPTAILLVDRKPGFPIINFLRDEPQEFLQNEIVEQIAFGRTSVIRFNGRVTNEKAGMVKHILTAEKLEEKTFKKVVRMSADRSSAPKILLTARGLLLNRILLLCLRKRWNVQYGLDLDRCPVAVPFEAKGVPSERSEFGHPDVAISLTCLSFYYQGLNVDQFKDGLQRVLRSDDPAAEYERWTGNTSLPPTLSQWNLINIEDAMQTDRLWQHLRLERSVINHYLNHFVFPIHAKQFAVKIQASAWDIPLIGGKSMTAASQARTTGFSGTNDVKIVLPGTIKQDDLPGLVHTNAEVLGYLLQSRNSGYRVTAYDSIRWTESQFLKSLAKTNIRVLIDAGAYVLEMDNKTLAEAWLFADTDAKAAVYFGRDHRIWVKYRGKTADVPLLATPFAEDLSECVVYLDESHTRGVDLKFPPSAKGALTLALGQTKDHTVQAAMRLRQLATTQSVVFFAPPDVNQSIIDHCKPGGTITSDHVVSWLLEQTCKANEDILGLHFAQGLDFCERKDAEWAYDPEHSSEEDKEKALSRLQSPESRTLAQLYGHGSNDVERHASSERMTPILKGYADDIHARRARTAKKAFNQDALEEVEQEREIEFQVEEEREIQTPKALQPFIFPGLHPALSTFARTGRLDTECGFETAFAFLATTETGKKYDVKDVKSKLFVSNEFTRTVQGHKDKAPGDEYVRSVDWILWSPKQRTGVVLIAEEANLLMTTLTSPGHAATHLLCYAAPVTKSMRHFSKLDYFSIPAMPANNVPPSWFATEIGILAGRLYFEGSELEDLKKYIGMVDGGAGGVENATRFSPNQAGFLLEWLALRRNTRDVLHTPMGHLCLGRDLIEGHPFFSAGT
ncbi:hypothetical protein BDZ85DRAFT_243893 [Elsinoe ampelina]|uniref:ubiquitinyl hydrolase 1 n=1 Tax=Elsinoe ampelina TaxID=302913 RepID=A0A6A6G0E4_9PEZI|nr:hypothetical protein BDZ85DRAFT_243893 [Elsinoe ampelina]